MQINNLRRRLENLERQVFSSSFVMPFFAGDDGQFSFEDFEKQVKDHGHTFCGRGNVICINDKQNFVSILEYAAHARNQFKRALQSLSNNEEILL